MYSPSNGSNFFTFQIGQLHESSMYKIKVYALNSKGKSDQVWISAQTLRKAEKYIYSNNTNIGDGDDGGESSLLFSSYSLNHIKIIMLGLCGFLLIVLLVIVISITYMSRFCQRIRRQRREQQQKVKSDDEQIPATAEVPIDTDYIQTNLGIQTVYTETTNDAICTEYYSNLLAAQYSPKMENNLEMLSLDLYSVSKGPPDLIPTFYYNNDT